jgi:1-acyl-sn-glycerol-3-phosphate acyltransferase
MIEPKVAPLNQEFERAGRRPGGAPERLPPLQRAWSLSLRGVAFVTYALAAATLGVLVIPIVRWVGRWRGLSDEELDVRSQWVIHRTTYWQTRLTEWIRVSRIVGVGTARLRERPLLIVANHPSLYDTPVLTRFLPQADFIVSGDWMGNPFLRGAITGGGYIPAENGALAVRSAVKRLRAGRTVVVFPEGTRTPPEGLAPFQRGAALMALRAGVDIVPVVIQVTPWTLRKGQSAADMPDETTEWRVEVGDPIRPSDYVLPGETNSAGARRLTTVLQDYFEKRWDSGSC